MQYLTQEQEIRRAISEHSLAKILWLDTEVADYDTKKPRLSLVQILADSTDLKGEHALVLDVLDRPDIIDYFIDSIMVNPGVAKVFHNAKYDLRFLGKNQAQNVTCTLEMVKEVPYYLVPLPNYQLKTLAQQLCHFPAVDKTEQTADWGQRPLSPRQLDYAAMDVVYLSQIYHRLLQLAQLTEPNPAEEDVEALALRYRQIEPEWKKLDTEVKHLKERLKSALNTQKVKEFNGFSLSQQQRTSKQVSLQELAKISHELDPDLHLPIRLTRDLEKNLGDIIDKLSIEEETKEIIQLRIKNQEEGDIPF